MSKVAELRALIKAAINREENAKKHLAHCESVIVRLHEELATAIINEMPKSTTPDNKFEYTKWTLP